MNNRVSMALCALALLAGCGAEPASTAATAASIKRQELEQGQKTMERAQRKIGEALELQQRARSAD